MKQRLFSLMFAIVASIGLLSAQYSGKCGKNLTWMLTTSDSTLTISGTGEMTDYTPYSPAPWVWKTYIKTIIIDGCTSIGDFAFDGCTNLTSISIPNSVTNIGKCAFYDCSRLTSINATSDHTSYNTIDGVLFNKENTTLILYPCGKQGEYTIPNTVTSIGNYAFYGCSGLTNITIHERVQTTGIMSFSECSNLSSVTWNAVSCTTYDDGQGYVYPPFQGCRNITTFTIGENVQSLPRGLCYGLPFTSIVIPDNVTDIGASAFYQCVGLTSITIPNSVTTIGDYAFGGIPNIVYNGTATGSPWGALNVNCFVDGYLIYSNNYKTKLLRCSKSIKGAVTIPNSVTSIGDYAFSNCSGLTSVIIPNSVTSIGVAAFEGCNSLTSITIPNSVRTIPLAAFSNCSGLTFVTIGNQVTSIKQWAFINCTGLKAIHSQISTPPTIRADVFEGCGELSNITLYVPKYSINIYNNKDVWKEFLIKKEVKLFVVTFLDKNGNVIDMQIIEEGSSASAPNAPIVEGWKFIGWDSPFDNIQSDMTITAQYKEIVFFTLTILSADTKMGIVSGNGKYGEGEHVTITAIPADGYRFVRWSDNNTDNPRTIVITEEMTLTAYFERIPDALEETDTDCSPRATKVFENGQLYILLPDNTRYNLQGMEVK